MTIQRPLEVYECGGCVFCVCFCVLVTINHLVAAFSLLPPLSHSSFCIVLSQSLSTRDSCLYQENDEVDKLKADVDDDNDNNDGFSFTRAATSPVFPKLAPLAQLSTRLPAK